MPFTQDDFEVRFDWGLNGLRNAIAASPVEAIIIVDVLSFGTSLDIALSRGARVYPARHADLDNESLARGERAVLANDDRFVASDFTLSPTSLLEIAADTRLVLPSPNGAKLCLQTDKNIPTFCAGLRNARSVARAAQSLGRRLVVIAAGDTWPDGSMRPALEDLWGAGAIIHYLKGTLSPEAQAAVCAFESFSRASLHLLRRSAGGRDLIEMGFGQDVELAAAINDSISAPMLSGGAFVQFKYERTLATSRPV